MKSKAVLIPPCKGVKTLTLLQHSGVIKVLELMTLHLTSRRYILHTAQLYVILSVSNFE